MDLLRRRPLTVVVVVVCTLLAAAAGARASGPQPPPGAYEMYAEATLVVVGKVESVGAKSMEVRVVEVLKGTPVANAAGTLTVGPIFQGECCVSRERTPIYRVGDRILLAAVRKDDAYLVYGERYGNQDLGDDAALTKAVALAREMLRIAGLPDESDRRAAMIALLLSDDPAYVEAADDFQYSGFNAPSECRPHAAGLTAALWAPLTKARRAALRALRGVAAPQAFERILELLQVDDANLASDAAAALAAYARDEAVEAIERAAAVPGRSALLAQLAESPQPRAQRRLHERIASGATADRALAYEILGARVKKFGATQEDIDVLLAFVRSEAAADVETYKLAGALTATRSVAVARAMVDMVRNPAWTSDRRHLPYWVLNVEVRVLPEVLDLARKEEALFVARLDEGDASRSLVEVLDRIHSTVARAAIERAAKSHPDEDARKSALQTLEDW